MLTDAKLATKTARAKLLPRWKPYPGPSLGRGVQLLYRRNKHGAGTWVVRAADGHGRYWTKKVGDADDAVPSNRSTVLTLHEAKAKALELASGDDQPLGDRPMTVRDALERYAKDLEHRGRHTMNARRVLRYLPSVLAGRSVGALTGAELRQWRDHLADKGMNPATINRTRVGMRAALRLAAGLDPRIVNQEAIRVGLKGVKDANRARDIVLADPGDVMRLVDAAYEEHPAFGLLIHVLAETGARVSQAAALDCYHLQIGKPDRLLMPASGKGRKSVHRHHEPVVISDELAAALARAREGRADNAPLLLNAKEIRWLSTDHSELRRPFRSAAERVGLDPDRYTSYCLRHSSIVRQLEIFPALRVAKFHDTSVLEIERHYARFANKSDRVLEMAKAALPKRSSNVVRLRSA